MTQLQSTKSPLAIVGIACRFPGGCENPDSFWQLLTAGRSGVCEVPPDRWDNERFYCRDSATQGTICSRWGGFVGGLDRFDTRFWSITPRESTRMDPQQRWLLEVAWEALEDSGTPPKSLRGKPVGVFVGIASTDYGGLQLPCPEIVDAYTNSGSTLSIAANRISYLLDLQGPSAAVDTACSSSLVAVWMACESIWSGSSVAALVGGVNALITPHASIGFSKASMLSPDGRCFAFDHRANGYVRGEGAGMVYIKPLDQALRDGDAIYAVIRAAVANQDGHTSSMTVPSVEGQSLMLRQAYAAAGLSPGQVVYMEAHGTGTPVGDPIELTALGRVLGEGRPAGAKCLIGSVKTNIGHLEAGSGMAGLVKASLVLQRKFVPASLNYEKPNPHIPFDTLPLAVASEAGPLPRLNGCPAVVGVNSFGFGGTNSHVVLEEAPPLPAKPPASGPRAERPFLLPISARDPGALRNYVAAYHRFLEDPALNLADVCYSAGARHEHHERRLVATGNDAVQIRRRLAAWKHTEGAAKGVFEGRAAAARAPVMFVFTGQGAQWWGMGRQLLAREPVFRRTLEEIDEHFRPLAGWSLLAEMDRPESDSQIDRTDIAQPLIFALQAALTQLWKSWGVVPAKVVGHSVGELAAAYCAGIYSLSDAVRIIYHRSRLQHQTGGNGNGKMVAVGVNAEEAAKAIGEQASRVQIAVMNSPNLVTLAGDAEPLEQIEQQLRQAGRFTRWLPIAYAFHTHQMDPIREELLRTLSDIQPRQAEIPLISTVTAAPLDGERMDAHYWWSNVREPVQFAPAICGQLSKQDHLLLEIGPHPALESSLKECQGQHNCSAPVLHSLRREADETAEILANLAGLHGYGIELNWAAINQTEGNFVRLPSYPWNRESLWLETPQSERARLVPLSHPLLGLKCDVPLKPTWEHDLDVRRLTYLGDHRIWGSSLLPGAGFAEIGLAVAQEQFPEEPHAVEELEMKKALFLPDKEPIKLQVVFDPESNVYSIYSRLAKQETWDLNATGRLTKTSVSAPAAINLAQLIERFGDRQDHEAHYGRFQDRGYEFGAAFKELVAVWRQPGEAVVEIEPPKSVASTMAQYVFHPAVLDACFQASFAVRAINDPQDKNLYLPQAIRRVHVYQHPTPSQLWAHARLVADEGWSLTTDIFVYDEAGRRVADILGFRVERLSPKRSAGALDDCLYQPTWEPRLIPQRRAETSWRFPAPSELAAAVRAQVPEIYERHQLKVYYEEVYPRGDALVVPVLQNAFLELGWSPQLGERFTLDEFIGKLRIIERHRRLVRSQLGTLAERGVLKCCGADSWEVLQLPVWTDLPARIAELISQRPERKHDLAFFERTAPYLATALSGDVDAVDLLFPRGSLECLTNVYLHGGDFPAFNEAMGLAVAAAIAAWPQDRVLRVLELGAGTCSLTKSVLPLLPADRTEYVLTDISPVFLASAKKEFADYPFVSYRTLDLEKDPAAQGFAPGSFDLVIASDVIHATSDVRRSLGHVRNCLADSGMFIFLEITRRRALTENINFGMLEGWWLFADEDLRTESPLLSREKWSELLTANGFSSAQSFACSLDDVDQEQAVLIASAGQCQQSVPRALPPAEEAATYLIFADQSGVAEQLAEKLCQAGNRVIRVAPGDDFSQAADTDFVLRPGNEQDLQHLLACLNGALDKLAGIVHCGSLDGPSADAMDLAQLQAAQRQSVFSAFHLLKHCASKTPYMWFVCRDACHAAAGDRTLGLATAPLIGLLRVANNELYPTRFVTVDIGDSPAAVAAEALLDEFHAQTTEREIAYRAGRRLVLRWKRAAADQLAPRHRNAIRGDGSCTAYRLQNDRTGVLAGLSLRETARPEPGPDEVEVRVHAGGINFRDVMKALGTYPGNPIDLHWYGDDFSGTVVRVGSNVQDFQVGDQVAGLAPYAFRAFVKIDHRLVFRKPAKWSFTEAATVSTVFLTAHYALNCLARMEPGESILIHGGAGGVGQAAIQIAQRLKLNIFATAGSPEKRDLLTSQGVPHVLNSRSLDFADEILERTQGRGVDAVLNSFAGDFIPKSLSVLAPYGRFLEIGKIDIYRNSKLGLERLKNNVSLFVIDLAQHMQHKPASVIGWIHELQQRFAAGDYRPLPHTVFPVTQAAEAFRHVAQGKHLGKDVLSFEGSEIPIGRCCEPGQRFRPDATYLITGGNGGFCLEVAKWMAREGARHLVLMSRGGPRDEAAQQDIERLREAGAVVIDARGDVTKREDVERVVQMIAAELPPLAGVLHGATVFDDEFIKELDDARFAAVLDVKMAGAWNLHLATRHLPLEDFLCFASISTVVGALKQSNYNAGNHFLSALCHYRRGLGMAGQAIEWGAIRGAGFVERNAKVADYLAMVGMLGMQVEDATAGLGQLIALDPAELTVSRTDWKLLRHVSPALSDSASFSVLLNEQRATESGGTLLARLQASPADSHLALIEQFIAEQVAGVFGITADKLDREMPLTNLGLDSLMAIELKNRIEKEAGIQVPMGELMHGPTLPQLAQIVLKQVGTLSTPMEAPPPDAIAAVAPPAEQEAEQAADLLKNIDGLSEAQIDSLLTEMEDTGLEPAAASAVAAPRN